ncbi:MAG: phosphonate C-P lyase system protein PhnH [Okeania sp. SIO3H1]|uniref:phosphonate C-P lyase system protein PhnH n=1 Tax=Okeania sp. SIO1I7 TaxID=2607772 RepID=UPI0013C95805|nr:phosphonate C-P lyase system protein PhnH [Okeania sp. SIO1I7]NEN88727.1 phosphonate C-P lyase system protein PhnH [Okeania sp. SIO3H1]NET26614.1 phosphonate C-P lyase system protein PhnH [Okeania sp. SIO1I7]
MITKLPGLPDIVHDSQITFINLLNALSYPGRQQQIDAKLTPPSDLNIACAAACLTMLDLETKVWLSSDFHQDVKAWLLFHTGCHFTENSQIADFAVIKNIQTIPNLSNFHHGTAEEPENSTTLFVQGANLESGDKVILTGPGILEEIAISIPKLPDFFWSEWEVNFNNYPLGVDIFFFAQNTVIGLPRTTKSRLVKM